MTTDHDLNMLKAVVEQTAIKAQPGGTLFVAEEAVENVLRVLYETPPAQEMWGLIYGAVKSAYVGQPDWGEEESNV